MEKEILEPRGREDAASTASSSLSFSRRSYFPPQSPTKALCHDVDVDSDDNDPSFAERCLGSFYHYFFASHPFVLPRDQLGLAASEPLVAAMTWIGSLFLRSPAADRLFGRANRLIHEADADADADDGHVVQAIMLMALGLDGCNRRKEAVVRLADAKRRARRMGLHTADFAARHGRQLPVLEESWRRTWWEMFVVDGILGSGGGQQADVSAALPCEESEYLSLRIPSSRVHLSDMDHHPGRRFSSFAYRILSAHHLGSLLRLANCTNESEHTQVLLRRIQRLVEMWRLHLSPDKREAFSCDDGSPDEMMFQAHMMNHAATILLHEQILCELAGVGSSSSSLTLTCKKDTDTRDEDRVEEMDRQRTGTAVAAATAISTMITDRVPMLSHTHLFTFAIRLSSLVHLRQWALLTAVGGGSHDDEADDEQETLRQQVRLNMAALHRLSVVWEVALGARAQVQAVAREIYHASKGRAPSCFRGHMMAMMHLDDEGHAAAAGAEVMSLRDAWTGS